MYRLIVILACSLFVVGFAKSDNKSHKDPPHSRSYSIDGSGNNLYYPEMGAANSPLVRQVDSDYADGISEMAGEDRPSARVISNIVHAQGDESYLNKQNASDFLWQWGQFIDHDIDLSGGSDPAELANIQVPLGDIYFDPQGFGGVVIPFNRSFHNDEEPRQQINEITSWIDGSNVYGSDPIRASALREHDGSGRMKVSEGDFLPFNTEGFPNAGGSSPSLFLAGDVRANEQVGLTALHILFVREHNYHADRIRKKYARFHLSGDEIFQAARSIVIGELQAITYREYLPALLGKHSIRQYSKRRYNPRINAAITNLFSTAAYRYGHSALSEQLLRLDKNGSEIAEGNLLLREAFFAPWRITEEGGIDPILRGLAAQKCQSIDPYIIDDVRNFLFGPPGAGGFDLAALNIQRGRDHGLPSYNDTRKQLGLRRAKSFADITKDDVMQERLEEAYGDVNNVDVWVGALAEDNYKRAMVGELIYHVVVEQFKRLRDGDRLWYKRVFPSRLAWRIKKTRLSDIIKRNTDIGNELPRYVFHITGN